MLQYILKRRKKKIPLIHRITEKDELIVDTIAIVLPAAIGGVTTVSDNRWLTGLVKSISAVPTSSSGDYDFALSAALLRNAGVSVIFNIGQRADGYEIRIYNLTNVAKNVVVAVSVVISR